MVASSRKRSLRGVPIPVVDEVDGKRNTNDRKASLPTRRSKRAKDTTTTFVDSSNAIKEDSGDSDVEMIDTVQRVHTRKRKRTPPPSLTPERFLESSARSTPSPVNLRPDTSSVAASTLQTSAGAIAPVSLNFNIPAGFQGPLTVNIDINDLLRAAVKEQVPTTKEILPCPPAPKVAVPPKQIEVFSKSTPGKVGFLDLPSELRNEIYRTAFIKDQRRFDFSSPSMFQRSSAFLRTCRQIAHEASSILYSEGEFYFRRNMSTRTPLWTTDRKEIGFADTHRFLKTIGPTNVGLLRHVFFLLEDAVPSLNPQLDSAEQRRYVHDDHLKAAIRLIADHGRLQTLKIGFFGRRNIVSDSHFLEEIKAIKADSVEVLARRCHPDWPRLYSNLQWPKILFRLALDVKTAVTRKRKFYPPWKEDRQKDPFESSGANRNEDRRLARRCADCGDVHV